MGILKTHQIDFRILDRPEVPVRKVAAGETIISEGGAAKEMFLLRKGRAEIRVKDHSVEEVGSGGDESPCTVRRPFPVPAVLLLGSVWLS